jgi:hypothetical protein
MHGKLKLRPTRLKVDKTLNVASSGHKFSRFLVKEDVHSKPAQNPKAHTFLISSTITPGSALHHILGGHSWMWLPATTRMPAIPNCEIKMVTDNARQIPRDIRRIET